MGKNKPALFGGKEVKSGYAAWILQQDPSVIKLFCLHTLSQWHCYPQTILFGMDVEQVYVFFFFFCIVYV